MAAALRRSPARRLRLRRADPLRALLRRAWHSPFTGPVILVLLGLPVLFFVLLMALAPLLPLVNFLHHRPRLPTWYGSVFGAAWAVAILLGVRAWWIARANRGLALVIEVVQKGRAVAPSTLARRLGEAIAAPGREVSAVIREDYGAGVWVREAGERFWLSVGGDGGKGAVIGLGHDPGFDLRRRLVHRVDRDVFAAVAADLRAAVAADAALLVEPLQSR